MWPTLFVEGQCLAVRWSKFFDRGGKPSSSRLCVRLSLHYTTDDGRDVPPLLQHIWGVAIASPERTRRTPIHDLRDTFATMHLMKAPPSLYWVSSQLGHKVSRVQL